MNAQVTAQATPAEQLPETRLRDGIDLSVRVSKAHALGESRLIQVFEYVRDNHLNRWQFDKFVKAVKAEHKRKGVTLCQPLSNMFSRFRKAFDLGLILSNYENQNQLIKAIKEHTEEPENEPVNVGEQGNPGGTAQPPESKAVKGLDVEPNEPDTLIDRVKSIADLMEGLGSDERETIAKDLDKIIFKIQSMINTKRVQQNH